MSDDGWSAPTLHRREAGPDERSAERPATPASEPAAEPDDRSGAVDAGYTALATGAQPTWNVDPVGVDPGGPDSGGWSATVLHHATDVRASAEAADRVDAAPPVAAGPARASAGASAAAPAAAPAWSGTTYGGARRYRPHPGERAEAHPAEPGEDHAAEPAEAQPATATPAAAADDAAASNRRLLSSSRTMAVASLVSRLTGLLRTAAVAAALGNAAHGIADPYNTANSLPNMVYELLVGGVLSSVLIPLIVYAQEHDRDRGVAYTQRLLSIATVVLGAATLLAVLAAPWISDVVVGDPSKRTLTTIFATLLLPEIFFYGVGALVMAVLNSRNVYGPPAWAPVLNNVVVIATLGLFALLPGGTPTLGAITDTQILVLGVGTTLGIVAQALVLLPSLRRSGFTWAWRFRAGSAVESTRLREVRTLALWVLGYVAASQVGVVVIQRVGNARPGGYTTFVNADLLFQVPYGILGVSLLTALMPRMSRAAANGDLRAVVADLGLGARLSAVALLPITFGLFVLGPSLTTSILLGKFAADQATFVGVVLAMSAFGLLPFALVMLQLRVFYAMHDARTPTWINVAMVATKVALVGLAATVFHSDVRVVEALSVATSASYVVGAVVGHVLLHRRLGRLGFRAVGVTAARVGLASAVGAGVAGLVTWGAHRAVDGVRLQAVVSLVGGAVLGGAAVVAVAWALRLPELRDVLAAVRPGPAAATHDRNSPPPAGVGAEAPSDQETIHP